MKILSILSSKGYLILFLLVSFYVQGCLEKENAYICLQGRYLGTYCDGMVVEVLGESDITLDWEGMFDSKIYVNSVVASIDTVFLSHLQERRELEDFILAGNIFYFQYKMGGYPRKKFNVCNPSPFITIFNISKADCYDNTED